MPAQGLGLQGSGFGFRASGLGLRPPSQFPVRLSVGADHWPGSAYLLPCWTILHTGVTRITIHLD